MGLVTRSEAEDWLKLSLKAYPDQEGEPIESYLRLFEYFVNYRARHRVNPPTWRTLVTWRSRNGGQAGAWTRHLAVNVIHALYEANVVSVKDPGRLRELLK